MTETNVLIYPTEEGMPSESIGIPQVDISMLLPDYPGKAGCLVGVRLYVEDTGEKGSEYKPCDVLFRVDSLQSFRTTASLLPGGVWPREVVERLILSKPYPIQIVSEDQMIHALKKAVGSDNPAASPQ